MLRPADEAALTELNLQYSVTLQEGFTLLVIHAFPVGCELVPGAADLLVRLPHGFPDAAPDMFWFTPALRRADGGGVPGTEVQQEFLGRVWQRWSRHINGQWRPGVDNLGTYLAYIRRCLDHAGGRS